MQVLYLLLVSEVWGVAFIPRLHTPKKASLRVSLSHDVQLGLMNVTCYALSNMVKAALLILFGLGASTSQFPRGSSKPLGESECFGSAIYERMLDVMLKCVHEGNIFKLLLHIRGGS